ncbi:hypothetical protein [Desulfolucanica intricata]|uniref:hypothetical protein n=1 Tax=Desulfolucanica intricata TaxID=1285191 RepID=UPI00082D552B|nr:hypothetical protein [Desulfolucanica intricata]
MGNKLIVPVVIFILFALAGCTYQSGEKTFEQSEETQQKPVENAAEIISTALNTTLNTEEAHKFWYSGWVANDMQKRRVTSMFDGVVVRPHGYVVNARLAGTPYRYYKWDDNHFLYTGDTGWTRVTGEQPPLDPFLGLTWWEPFFGQAVQLPDQEVLGRECRVISIEVSGAQWLEKSSSPLFADLRKTASAAPGMEELLEESRVKMTLWTGIEDNLIYQYRTWINLPVPGAGYMDQEIYFRFYKYGDPGIELKTPREMEQEMSVQGNAVDDTR